jgi:hypothetical protein
MINQLPKLLCDHEYKVTTVYLGEDKLKESCSNCGKKRRRKAA